MASSQHFTFRPPDREGLTVLHVEEAPAVEGSWVEIDTSSEVGSYPEYITEYTTDEAVDPTDWFRIRWSDGKGAYTPFSEPLKGNTTTLVGEIVKRARERDRGLDVNVLAQEAEAVIEYIYGEDTDPYDVTLTSTYRKLNGMVYLTMARAMVATRLSGGEDVASATLGMVSFKSTSTSKSADKAIAGLIDLAQRDLGIPTSVILQMEEAYPLGIGRTSTDHSRLIGWVGLQ